MNVSAKIGKYNRIGEQVQKKPIRLPPETWQAIFSDFALADLYHCLLVDRHWCWNVVSLLWRDPFQIKNNDTIISIYLAFLNVAEREELLKAGVFVPAIQKPTFEYPAFLKSVDYWNLGQSVGAWLSRVKAVAEEGHEKWESIGILSSMGQKESFRIKKGKGIIPHNSEISIDLYPKVEIVAALEKEYPYPRFIKQNEIGDITYRSAIKRALVKMMSRLAPAASRIVLDSPDDFLLLGPIEIVNWLSSFQELKIVSHPLEYDKYPVLCQGCTNLENLSVDLQFERSDWNREGQAEMQRLSNFVRTLQKLTSFRLKTTSSSLILNVKELCMGLPKTLRHLSFESVNFTCMNTLAPLTQLQSLETLEFRFPAGLEDYIVAPLVSAKFPKLRRVNVVGCGCPDELRWWADRINHK
ncbi:hypothetical protein G9A89_007261 [Geosiphon pyriformis]|nr:hypothetical protein G9A89_007261 [Geosiphon pyriformis]